MSQPEDPTDPRNLRKPWTEGPDEEAPEESWLSLGDDELLHRIEGGDSEGYSDETLVEVVQSDRHFFIRQEAAKQVKDRRLLFPFEDDRHIGQILVRYLTRREDVTYLERLVARSRHVEVRAAAQVQLAQLWGRLGGPSSVPEGQEAPPPPEFAKPVERLPPSEEEEIDVVIEIDEAEATGLAEAAGLAAASLTEPASLMEPASLAQAAGPAEAVGPAEATRLAETPETAASPDAVDIAASGDVGSPAEESPEPPAGPQGVDGSLLGWAAHFVVEQVWAHLDTRAARGLLLRTHAELLPFQPALTFFRVEEDAHVHVDLTGGARIPVGAVEGVATWMSAFLAATRASVPEMEEVDVRQSTRLMADALEEVGFYEAFRRVEEA